MVIRRLVSLFVCLLTFALVPAADAQTTATIAGTVTDPNGGVLPGVTVTVTNVGTSLVRTGISSPEGRYAVPALPPGRYDIRAELAGFKPHVRRDLELTIGESLALNIVLALGDL